MSVEQPALFDMPEPLPHNDKPLPRAGAAFTKLAGMKRPLCDDCVRAIHALGVAVAPYPSRARWRVAAGGDRICHAHKQNRENGDGT